MYTRSIFMKIKVLSVVLALAVALTVFSGIGFTVSAEEFTEGYYTYTVTDGKATIISVDKSISGDVVVPATLGGYPVTEVGKFGFSSYCDRRLCVLFSYRINNLFFG